MFTTNTETRQLDRRKTTGANFTDAHNPLHRRCAFRALATTQRSLIYMIIGGLGTLWQTLSDDEAERRGTMPSGARRRSDPRCNLLRERTRKSGKRKRMRQIRVFMRETIWSWMARQWSCQRQSADNSPLLGKDILGGDTDAEKELKYWKQWNT